MFISKLQPSRVTSDCVDELSRSEPQPDMIYDNDGFKKYLSGPERSRFMQEARKLPLDKRAFCLTIAATGCRISEALMLRAHQVNTDERAIVFETLKRRRPGVFRAVPVHDDLISTLSELLCNRGGGATELLWPWCRATGWSVVKSVMATASISGRCASPKGLRHAFAVAAIQRGIPLNLVQRWLGHARIETTALYAGVIGEEERSLATKLWSDD